MANIRAGVAYVDVKLGSVEKFKVQLKEKVESSVTESAKSSSKKFSETFTKETRQSIKKGTSQLGTDISTGFIASASQGIRNLMPLLRTSIIGGLATAAVALAPFVVSALGGAIIAAIGSGVIGAGIFGAILADPKIGAAGEKAAGKFFEAFERSTFLFRIPVMNVIKWFTEMLDPLESIMRGIFGNTAQYVEPFGRVMIAAINDIMIGIRNLTKAMKPVMDALFVGLLAVTKAIGDFFTKLASDPEAMRGFAEGLKDLFQIATGLIMIFGDLLIFFSKLYLDIKFLWQALLAVASNTVAGWKRVGSVIAGVFSAIWAAINVAVSGIKKLWSSLTSSFSSTMNSVKTTVSGGFNQVVAFVRTVPGKIVAALSGLGSALFSAGFNAMLGFFNGISSMGGAIISKARSIASTVIAVMGSVLQLGSPSKVMEQIGVWTVEGFNKGLDKTAVNMGNMLSSLPSIDMNVGDIKNPMYDSPAGGSAALQIENYYANDNVDPWRQAEDWYFMVNARGGVA